MYFPKLEDWDQQWDWEDPILQMIHADIPCSRLKCKIRCAIGEDGKMWVWHGDGEAIRSFECDEWQCGPMSGLNAFVHECHRYGEVK